MKNSSIPCDSIRSPIFLCYSRVSLKTFSKKDTTLFYKENFIFLTSLQFIYNFFIFFLQSTIIYSSSSSIQQSIKMLWTSVCFWGVHRNQVHCLHFKNEKQLVRVVMTAFDTIKSHDFNWTVRKAYLCLSIYY